jgi:hypothetical protein
MSSGSGRNQLCPCGSGVKQKNCACQTRRPRTRALTLDYGVPVAIDGVRIASSGELALTASGTAAPPLSAYIETTYQRDAKKPKIIHRTPLDPRNLSVDPNLALERFDLLLAIDTNFVTRPEGMIAMSCIVHCDYTSLGHQVLVEFEARQLFELRNVVGPPERIAWWLLIENVRSNAQFDSVRSVGIVVDSDFGNIAAYNERSRPILDEFYLPPKFELLYATADTGSEFIANKLIVCADRMAKALLERLVAGDIPDDGLLRISDQPFTHYRIWLPSRGSGPRQTLAPKPESR